MEHILFFDSCLLLNNACSIVKYYFAALSFLGRINHADTNILNFGNSLKDSDRTIGAVLTGSPVVLIPIVLFSILAITDLVQILKQLRTICASKR